MSSRTRLSNAQAYLPNPICVDNRPINPADATGGDGDQLLEVGLAWAEVGGSARVKDEGLSTSSGDTTHRGQHRSDSIGLRDDRGARQRTPVDRDGVRATESQE